MASSTVVLRTSFDERTFHLSGEATDNSVVRTIAEHEGRYEPEMMTLLHCVLPPDAVVLDVGANIGTISLVLDHLLPEGHIHAFEPEPHNLRHLHLNLETNGARNVSVHPYALSDSRSPTTLSYLSDFAGGSFISDRVREGQQQIVETVPLDDWAEKVDLKRLDLVKLDVEGAELRVLAGGPRTLSRFDPALIVECNPVALKRFQGTSIDDLYGFLRKHFNRVFYVREDPHLGRVLSLDHLRRLLTRRGVINLFATNKAQVPVCHSGPKSLGRSLAELAFLRWTYNRFRTPAHNFVVDPSYELGFPEGELLVAAGSSFVVEMDLRNTSTSWLSSAFIQHPVALGYQWLAPDGTLTARDNVRSVLPRPIAPGGRLTAPLQVVAPSQPGDFWLRVSVVQENFAWFHQLDERLGPTRRVTVQ